MVEAVPDTTRVDAVEHVLHDARTQVASAIDNDGIHRCPDLDVRVIRVETETPMSFVVTATDLAGVDHSRCERDRCRWCQSQWVGTTGRR